MNEIWKEIKDFSDYQISNFGRIKSLKFKKEKILKYKKNKGGYLYIKLAKNGKYSNKYIHILEFESFNNYILNDNECIHHIDGDTMNNNLYNLKLMNKFDHLSFHKAGKNHPMFGKKRPEHSKKMSGKNGPKSILTEQKVIEIWKDLNKNILTQKEIGKKFGVKQNTISRIKNKKIWRYMEEPIC